MDPYFLKVPPSVVWAWLPNSALFHVPNVGNLQNHWMGGDVKTDLSFTGHRKDWVLYYLENSSSRNRWNFDQFLSMQRKKNGSWPNLFLIKNKTMKKKTQWFLGEFEGRWSTRNQGEKMWEMVPRLGSVSGCPRPTPWRRRCGAYGHKCIQVS